MKALRRVISVPAASYAILQEVVKLLRRIGKKRGKVGLALGGGAARGLAHVGVLAVLQKGGIPVDMIAGTSAGALVGAMYARERDANVIKNQILSLNWKRLASLVDLALPKTGFIGGKKITSLLREFIGGDVRFSDLPLPLSCVATDIIAGEEVVISEGSVLEAVRASISIPILFTVVERQGRHLVDGGLVNPVPVSVVKDMGADFVIAVNVIPDSNEAIKAHKELNIFNVVLQSMYIGTHSLVKSSLEGADLIISPAVARLSPHDFHRAHEFILHGELAAKDAILEIKKRLGLK